ncbi:hypothetical protein C5167_009397 [Papaver somniferum]|uniref:Protein kinase domain-containing protein n=1 Tax=Papaver somniferum TaxID=3469 RepID=A0A4Y7JXA2_PAPSO|nr:hypothetical protein C5167_009397 [Papaver somniferum]
MEYVSGGTLTEAIQEQKGKLDEFSIKSYTGEILRGLNYLHSNGLVHCDIKGRNILIGENGAKIADLGCAKWMDEVSNSSRISGTPVFMAPEVARGEEQGCPADIWALGCTIIEMATGRAPWSSDGDDAVSVLYRIAFSGEVPEFPSFLSENAKDFLSKCLERDLKKRWNTNQLLKHPFVDEFNSKQFKESKMKSPTSILDQDFWDSMEEVIETPRNVSTGCSSVSVIDRLRKISSPIEPNWECEDDWITIRNENCQESVNFSGEEFEFSTISVDEPTTAPTSGSDSVYNDDDEDKVEFSGRFDFENDEVPVCAVWLELEEKLEFNGNEFVIRGDRTRQWYAAAAAITSKRWIDYIRWRRSWESVVGAVGMNLMLSRSNGGVTMNGAVAGSNDEKLRIGVVSIIVNGDDMGDDRARQRGMAEFELAVRVKTNSGKWNSRGGPGIRGTERKRR